MEQLPVITSASNAHLRHAESLLGRARERREEQAFVIEGLRLFMDTPENLIREVFVSGKAAEEALSSKQEMGQPGARSAKDGPCARETEDTGEPGQQSLCGRLQSLLARDIPVWRIPDDLMVRVSDTQTPQGILAVVRKPAWTPEDLLGKQPFLLILENVQDPGNLGTMFRTAEAAGATGILMSRGTVDPTNPKTIRATMSSIFRMPFYVAEPVEFMSLLRVWKEQGIRLFAAHLSGEKPYDLGDYRTGCGILIGNEGNGLTPETTALADELVRIPMSGRIESLNAAMAAGILMYEAARQRRQGK